MTAVPIATILFLISAVVSANITDGARYCALSISKMHRKTYLWKRLIFVHNRAGKFR
jgi:hypothetical protein